jgi:outer membrane receptor protein involved in Fe transport
LNRTDVIPVLAILAGGALGVVTTAGVLLSARSAVEAYPRPTIERNRQEAQVIRVWAEDGRTLEVRREGNRRERRRVDVMPLRVSVTQQKTSLVRQLSEQAGQSVQPIIYVDDVRVDRSWLDDADPDDIESVTVLRGPNAVELYGEDASADGVILITLK